MAGVAFGRPWPLTPHREEPTTAFPVHNFFFVISATQKGRSHFTVYTLININGICHFIFLHFLGWGPPIQVQIV